MYTYLIEKKCVYISRKKGRGKKEENVMCIYIHTNLARKILDTTRI